MTPPSDVFIQATETDPELRAARAVRAGHDDLLAALHARLAALLEPRPGLESHEQALADLAGLCADPVRGVRGHLAASDQALYAPAAGAADTRLLVRALRITARSLNASIDSLEATRDPRQAAVLGHGIAATLAAHAEVECAVLLPALAALPGADPVGAAEDWRTLLDGGRLDRPEVIDATELPHGQRHPRIFARFARLAPGESFTLVNNHDPKPLRREFEASHPGAFTWDYLKSGPQRWQVRIGRVAADA